MPISPRHAAAALASTTFIAAAAHAQLTPDRLYYGVNRAIPMTIEAPRDMGGEIEIVLHRHGVDEPVETASAEAGRVDLAGLFPVLWTTSEHRVLFAQLRVGGVEVGPPVVLQPMLTPSRAVSQAGRISWRTPPAPVFSGLRAWTDRHIVLETNLGEVEIALRPDEAPNTVYHVLGLVEGGFYTDIIFHRVVPMSGSGHPFVVQAGDPTGRGDGGPGQFIDLEKSELPHDFGVMSMARTNDPDTNGSQFFLCLSREGTSFLDGNYTAFAQSVRGADTIVALSRVALRDEQSGRPVEPPVIQRAYTTPAPPFSQRPDPVSRPQGDAETPR
ncbi:MAG: peptidylprolyl isomerase [Phycisphaerales bacterium]|nr:MAG: peptidylprolyl isomerase [Phycisphaerales bacterium]